MTSLQPIGGDTTAGYDFETLASGFAPEADLLTVAGGDFSALSSPIIVACRDQKQFDEFCFREGLMCSKVRRFRLGRWNPQAYRADKILILLPDWWEHLQTRKAVEQWVNQLDRHTVEFRSADPFQIVRAWRWMLAASVAAWVIVASLLWWVFQIHAP